MTHTIAELAEKLNAPEPTIRRYIGHFGLPTQKDGRKVIASDETLQILVEIMKLKDNGMSLQQIKDLRDGGATQATSTDAPETKPAKKTDRSAVQKKQNEKVQKVEKIQKAQVVKSDETAMPKKHVVIPVSQKTISEEETKIETKTEEPAKVMSQADQDAIVSELMAELEPQRAPRHDRRPNHNNNRKGHHPQQQQATPQSKPQQQQQVAVADTPILNKDNINNEITVQSRKVAKLNRLVIAAKKTPKDYAELKGDLDRRYAFLAGLRALRDNWLNGK